MTPSIISSSDKVTHYLQTLTARTGLDLTFELQVLENKATAPPAHSESPAVTEVPSSTLTVDLAGPDTPLLLARNGELLHAIEHIAAKILRLEPEDHDRISFDAEGFKALRNAELERSADLAIQSVRTTGRPWSFAPMNSRERRLLHLILSRSGLPTASSGLNPRRFVVLYPEGAAIPAEPAANPSTTSSRPAPPTAERTEAIRNRFRRR